MQESGFLPAMIAPMAASLIEPIASSFIQHVGSSLINVITGKKVMRAGKGQKDGLLLLLALSLMMKVLGKGIRRARRRYNNIDHMNKSFSRVPSFKQYQDY